MPRTPLPFQGPPWFVQLAEAYVRTLARRNRSIRTQTSYRKILRRFGRHLEFCRVAEPEHLIPAVLQAWQDQLAGERKLKPASQAQAVSALRSMLRWAGREETGIRPGLWDHLETVSVPEQLPRALEPDVVDRIIGHYSRADHQLDDDELGYLELRRDRALFLFLLSASCRISEALSLRRDQVETGRLVVVQKGGSQHVLVPSANARAWLNDYLYVRGEDDVPALWVWFGRRRRRMTLGDANRIWAVLCRRLRLPKFTSHVLRHTGATEMGEGGASDVEIARHLGHKTPQMVIRYRKVRDARRQQLADLVDRPMEASPAPAPVAAAAPARRSRKRSRAEIMGGKRKR